MLFIYIYAYTEMIAKRSGTVHEGCCFLLPTRCVVLLLRWHRIHHSHVCHIRFPSLTSSLLSLASLITARRGVADRVEGGLGGAEVHALSSQKGGED